MKRSATNIALYSINYIYIRQLIPLRILSLFLSNFLGIKTCLETVKVKKMGVTDRLHNVIDIMYKRCFVHYV